jgi:hypothetical protein
VLYWERNDSARELTEEQEDTLYRRVARFQLCA